MLIVGIDLAGPSNSSDTALALFTGHGSELVCSRVAVGLDDHALLELVSSETAGQEAIVGIDAPLSYNPGGSDRPGDAALRRRLLEAGLPPGSVMPPTMTRMVYLTLRGICVARALQSIRPHPPRIVEVHPGGSLVLGGAPAGDVRAFKSQEAARSRLLAWLERRGLRGLTAFTLASDHVVAACACAYAAWKWARGEAGWNQAADPPFHPFDFAC